MLFCIIRLSQADSQRGGGTKFFQCQTTPDGTAAADIVMVVVVDVVVVFVAAIVVRCSFELLLQLRVFDAVVSC